MNWPKAIFSGILFLSTQSMGAAGPITSGGGDFYAMEFVSTGRDLVAWLRGGNHPAFPPALTGDTLNQTIDTTLVESTDQKLEISGTPKDALNFPKEKRILFNRDAWKRKETVFERNQLVLHEYLGIMGIPDDKYQISSQVGAIEGAPIDFPPVCELQANKLAEGLGSVNSMNVKDIQFLRTVPGDGTGYEYYDIKLENDTNYSCYLGKFSTETMCSLVSVEGDPKCTASMKK